MRVRPAWANGTEPSRRWPGIVRPSLRPPLSPFVDALPLPRRILADQHGGELTVPIRAATHRFHRDLPTSRVWAYDGRVPGPTIEAERGRPVRVHWRNEIDQPYPVASTLAPTETDGDGVPVQCLPAVSDYPMDQRAALLWYHDHVMGVTQLTVYAGLAGLWIIREERERALGLPEGPPFEVPLLLADRNFGLGADGQLTGALVHKTDPGRMEAFAPFTVVNGKVWPVLEVQPATYRLRVLNGSNARTFRLVLLRDGHPELERISQIVTDSGLLPAPVAVPAEGLVLASAERADLLVDFSELEPGSQLTLVNTAGAPFDGQPFPAARASEAANLDQLLPYPDVMRFRAVAGPSTRRPPPERLATDLTAPTRADLSGAVQRAVALVEQELDDMPNMLTMRELADVSDGPDEPVITVVDQDGATVTRLRTLATHFEDATTFFPMLGGWEVWQLINLSGDTHPIHLHLDPFHVLGRRPITVTVPDDGIGDHETTATVRLAPAPDDELDHVVDANEGGLKDTVRVNPNEIVELAVRFSTYSGRYMYHCHILEHEDRDMMRPIVIMPAQLMAFMT